MNKMNLIKHLTSFLIFAGILSLLSGCSIDFLNSEDAEEKVQQLLGTWSWQSSSSGTGSDPNGEPTSTSGPSESDRRENTYTEDGGYTSIQTNAEGEELGREQGSWSLDDDELTISFGSAFSIKYDIEITDGTLTRTRVSNEDGFEYWLRDRWSKK